MPSRASSLAGLVALALLGVATASAAPAASLRGSRAAAAGEAAEAGPAAEAANSTAGVVLQLASGGQSVAKALHVGDASGRQLGAILAAARTCFDGHPIDTSNVGQLDGTLGGAVGCVQQALSRAWGWQPTIDSYGSASCGQCDGYGKGSTVIEVVTPAGSWMFLVALEGAQDPSEPSAAPRGRAVALQRGDATDAQLADILRAADGCFGRHAVDTSNLGQLQGTLGAAVACVQSECEGRWGFKPRVSSSGSHSCGRCDGYGLGATVVAVDSTASGDWLFVMRLK